VIEDDSVTANEADVLIKATSVEPETGTMHLLSSLRREELQTLGSSDASITPHPFVEPVDRPTSPFVPPPEYPSDPIISKGNRGGVIAASYPSAITPPLPQQPDEQGDSTSDKEDDDWEIVRIIRKRRRRGADEYKVRWKSSWLPRSELGNAKRLVREFEMRDRTQQGARKRRAKCSS